MGAVITGHVYQYFAPVVVKETKTNRSFFSLFAMVPLYVVSFTHGSVSSVPPAFVVVRDTPRSATGISVVTEQ